MEWTNGFVLKLISVYEKYPVLWDANNKFYKVLKRKSDAWKAISEELHVDVAEVKKKITSLLATYRKVRQKLANGRKSRAGVDEIESYRGWFAYKAFSFLHNKYTPRRTIKTEDELEEEPQSQADTESLCDDEPVLPSTNAEESVEDAPIEEAVATPPPAKKPKVTVSRTCYNTPRKRKHDEGPRIQEAYNVLKAAKNNQHKDEFSAYGEYVANVLRSMDKTTCAYVKKEFNDIIFKAESGLYMSNLR